MSPPPDPDSFIFHMSIDSDGAIFPWNGVKLLIYMRAEGPSIRNSYISKGYSCSTRKVRLALSRYFNGPAWQGHSPIVYCVRGRGGNSGWYYEIRLDSLSNDMKEEIAERIERHIRSLCAGLPSGINPPPPCKGPNITGNVWKEFANSWIHNLKLPLIMIAERSRFGIRRRSSADRNFRHLVLQPQCKRDPYPYWQR